MQYFATFIVITKQIIHTTVKIQSNCTILNTNDNLHVATDIGMMSEGGRR